MTTVKKTLRITAEREEFAALEPEVVSNTLTYSAFWNLPGVSRLTTGGLPFTMMCFLFPLTQAAQSCREESDDWLGPMLLEVPLDEAKPIRLRGLGRAVANVRGVLPDCLCQPTLRPRCMTRESEGGRGRRNTYV